MVSYDRDSDEETSDEDQSQEETASDIDENTNDNDVDSNAGGQVKTGVDIGSMHIDSNQLQNASSKRVDTIGEAVSRIIDQTSRILFSRELITF